MDAIKIVAIVFVIGGALGLAFGGFSYTDQTHSVELGPVHLQVSEQKHVNVPLWAGAGAMVFGILLLVVGPRNSRS